MAVAAGVRALICMIPEPRRIRSVTAARYPSDATASIPHASADQTVSAPSRSAAAT